LATIGYDPSYGARPLKRVIQKYVINTLSEKILSGEIGEGETVEIGTDHRGMIEFVTKVKPEIVHP
jgi:ATP-dependent Clp protease ATP-binding subunit ClpA